MSDLRSKLETKREGLPAFGLHSVAGADELRACIHHLTAEAQRRMDERVRCGNHGGLS